MANTQNWPKYRFIAISLQHIILPMGVVQNLGFGYLPVPSLLSSSDPGIWRVTYLVRCGLMQTLPGDEYKADAMYYSCFFQRAILINSGRW